MNANWFDVWLGASSLPVIGLVLFALMALMAAVGSVLRAKRAPAQHDGSQQGYIVSAVLGLMALLLGFTFSLAVDRYDTRRQLVLESANAIGTAYLQVQLLGEPHRTRLSDILVRYTENAIVLAQAKPGRTDALVAKDDRILTELWAATAAGFDSVRNLDFSATLAGSMNLVIDMDAARRAARVAHVPTTVFLTLFFYFIVTAGVLGYVLTGKPGRLSAGFLLGLMVLSLMLILDIDRPTIGGVRESQTPMIQLRESMAAQPPAIFDRWREPGATP